jgi:hypothetical protein
VSGGVIVAGEIRTRSTTSLLGTPIALLAEALRLAIRNVIPE